MSGPLALESQDGRDDTLTLRLSAAPERTLAPRTPRAPDDPVDRLAADMADQIGPAVHAWEVAALLESEGLTGEQIRERYRHQGLFSLARDLYGRVPRSFPEPARGPDPWAPDHVRCALRGMLFALPGLAYVLTGRLWQGERGVFALIAAGLLSWAWGQALSHRAYLRLVVGRREAGRTLLLGAPAGALISSAAAVAVAGPGPATLFAVGQSLYLAAAGVLLVCGRERILLATLTPLLAGTAVLPWWEPGGALRIALPTLTALLSLAVAGHCVRGMLRTEAVPGERGAGPRIVASLPYGVFGLAAGTLVVLVGRNGALAVVALTVSMGPAEWLLYRYRGLALAALRATADETGFRLRSAGTLTACLGGYLIPLVPAALMTSASPWPVVAVAALLWTALLLQAFGIAWIPAVVSAGAASAAMLAAAAAGPPDSAVLLLCTATAALLLTASVLWLLGRPTAHA
ncbi:hypothetical protein V1460_19350 [Streptomyces sp. SCSIO 30461]|uniref:hypothetical protein n=1 Tax=Streptomyces sp. SCSIO 30461 TaxID=3118085 RepID=UPI0030D444A7